MISGKCTFAYDFYHHLTIREGLVLLRDTFPCPRFFLKRKGIYTIFVVTLFLHKNLALGLNRLSNIVFKFSWNLAQTFVKFWKSTFTILPFFLLWDRKALFLIKTNLSIFYTRILWAMFVWKWLSHPGKDTKKARFYLQIDWQMDSKTDCGTIFNGESSLKFSV